jgi:hypothetical protein
MGRMFVASSTKVTGNPRATFISMPRFAGERRRLKRRITPVMLMLHARSCRRRNYETGQSLPSLHESGRGKLPLVPANIRRPKQGKVASTCNSVSLLSQRLSLIRNCRAEIVRWVSENKRPFSIVKDRGFQTLMKTGRPDFHIPSPETVSRDVKDVFVRVRKRIATMLQVRGSLITMYNMRLTLISAGSRRGPELCDRRMDGAQSQSICCGFCPF